eukprot:186900_1
MKIGSPEYNKTELKMYHDWCSCQHEQNHQWKLTEKLVPYRLHKAKYDAVISKLNKLNPSKKEQLKQTHDLWITQNKDRISFAAMCVTSKDFTEFEAPYLCKYFNPKSSLYQLYPRTSSNTNNPFDISTNKHAQRAAPIPPGPLKYDKVDKDMYYDWVASKQRLPYKLNKAKYDAIVANFNRMGGSKKQRLKQEHDREITEKDDRANFASQVIMTKDLKKFAAPYLCKYFNPKSPLYQFTDATQKRIQSTAVKTANAATKKKKSFDRFIIYDECTDGGVVELQIEDEKEAVDDTMVKAPAPRKCCALFLTIVYWCVVLSFIVMIYADPFNLWIFIYFVIYGFLFALCLICVLVEACGYSKTPRYLKNMTNSDQLERRLKTLRGPETIPSITWIIDCYHNETVDQGSDMSSTTRKVTSHSAKKRAVIVRYGDVTNTYQIPSDGVFKINVFKRFIGRNMDRKRYEKHVKGFYNTERCDDYQSCDAVYRIPGVDDNHKQYLIADSNHMTLCRRILLNRLLYFVLTLLGLSYLYRVWFDGICCERAIWICKEVEVDLDAMNIDFEYASKVHERARKQKAYDIANSHNYI